MGCLFFTDQPVYNLDDAMRADRERFKKYFHGMLAEGIYFAPSAFEAGFLSNAHTEADVDATIVTRILDAGGTIIGKTNCEDMSFSGSSHTNALGPIRNPHKPTHSVGGSSGGSAAAIVAGDCELTTGGDQGGSIRIPASWSGRVGHKPTYGLVPYTGAMMIEMTMDHVGPMADNVENCARLLSAMAGPDPLDPRQRGVIPKNYVKD